MPPGGALMRVILSEAKVGDLVAAKIRYEPERGIFWDSSDTVKVNSIRLTSQESDKYESTSLPVVTDFSVLRLAGRNVDVSNSEVCSFSGAKSVDCTSCLPREKLSPST